MHISLRVKLSLLLSDFNETISRQLFEKKLVSNFMEICPVGADLLLADGHSDRNDEASSLFSQFCEGA